METSDIVRYVSSEYQHSHFWWEWQIPVDLFFAGLVAGLMIMFSVRLLRGSMSEWSDRFRLSAWLVPAFLSICMVVLLLDLESKLNAYRFYMAFVPTAPMSWGSWIILMIFPVSIIFALALLPEKYRQKLSAKGLGRMLLTIADWAKEPARMRKLAWIILSLGLAFGIYTGVLLSNMISRPLWSSALLGPLFLASGVSTAAATLLLCRPGRSERQTACKVLFGFLAAQVIVLILFLASLMNGTAVQQMAVELLVQHTYAIVFWTFVVIAGLITPLVIAFRQMNGKGNVSLVAPMLVLIGAFALRWIIVFAGQMSHW